MKQNNAIKKFIIIPAIRYTYLYDLFIFRKLTNNNITVIIYKIPKTIKLNEFALNPFLQPQPSSFTVKFESIKKYIILKTGKIKKGIEYFSFIIFLILKKMDTFS